MTAKNIAQSLSVEITAEDKKRLTTRLSGWNRIVSEVAAGKLTEPDLRKMLVLEMADTPRRPIVEMLIARLSSAYRKKLRRVCGIVETRRARK